MFFSSDLVFAFLVFEFSGYLYFLPVACVLDLVPANKKPPGLGGLIVRLGVGFASWLGLASQLLFYFPSCQ